MGRPSRSAAVLLTTLVAATSSAGVSAQFVNRTLPHGGANETSNSTSIRLAAVASCGTSTAPLNRYDTAVVCVRLNDQMAAFNVVVDGMSGLALLGTYNLGTTMLSGESISMAVMLQGTASDDPIYSTSAPRVIADFPAPGTTTRYFTTYTAIIQLVKGVPTSITFDDGCFLCDSSKCAVSALNQTKNSTSPPAYMTNCYIDGADCSVPIESATNASAGSSCDTKIFVVWIGTDAAGNFMTSAGRRFSMFRQYGAALSSVYNIMAGLAGDAASRADDTTNRDPTARRLSAAVNGHGVDGQISAGDYDHVDVVAGPGRSHSRLRVDSAAF